MNVVIESSGNGAAMVERAVVCSGQAVQHASKKE
jgi:hypothetical protein